MGNPRFIYTIAGEPEVAYLRLGTLVVEKHFARKLYEHYPNLYKIWIKIYSRHGIRRSINTFCQVIKLPFPENESEGYMAEEIYDVMWNHIDNNRHMNDFWLL